MSWPLSLPLTFWTITPKIEPIKADQADAPHQPGAAAGANPMGPARPRLVAGAANAESSRRPRPTSSLPFPLRRRLRAASGSNGCAMP